MLKQKLRLDSRISRYRKIMVRIFANLLCLALLLTLTGCTTAPRQQPEAPPKREDSLIGQIIDPVTRQPISFTSMVDRAAGADVVYFGEKHDNVQHHAQQLKLLQALTKRGVKPALGFEFFDVGQTAFLMQYVDAKAQIITMGHKPAKENPQAMLRRQLGWQDRSDRDWQFYFQLIELAKLENLEVFGADLPLGLALRISRGGIESLNGVEKGLLKNSEFADETYRRYMIKTFKDSHCGWGEEPSLSHLYQTWLARNHRMAQSVVQMYEASPGRPVVLVVGNGHVEHNRGVVEQVAALSPGIRQLNVGMWEIAMDPQPLSEYLESNTGMDQTYDLPHDLIWFSQRHDYTDPCEAFKTL